MKLDRDGVHLGYDEAGSGESSMLLIHGAFADRSSYVEQFHHFAEEHRVVAVDLRGHGESDKPDEEYSIPGFAEDVAWMADQLGLVAPTVIGHSLGGPVAVELAGHLGVGRAIATLDSPSVIPGWTLLHPGKYDEAIHSDDFRETLRGFLAAAYLPVDDAERLREGLDRVDQVPAHVVRRTWDALMQWDPTSALEALEVPFLYLDHGQPDVDYELLRRHCPQLLTGQTVGAGHRALQEVPDQVNAMLRRYMEHAEPLSEYARANSGSFQYISDTDEIGSYDKPKP